MSPALRFPLAIAVVKLQSKGIMMRATSAAVSEMPYHSADLLCGVCNVHMLFLAIHVVSKCERRLAQTIGLSLQLLQFVLGDDTDLED